MDPVIYLSALSPEDQSQLLPRLNRAIPDCGGWIHNRGRMDSGLARVAFEFPRDICVEVYSALVSLGLELTPSSHQALTELCRCTPYFCEHSSRRSAAADEATLEAATMYICSLQIIKVQLQIDFVSKESSGSQTRRDRSNAA